MLESSIIFALSIGIISALSLPLGALTTLVWKPRERTVAWLMAFGAGALLSAVTIDLFAPALEKDQFYAVAAGAILGSLFYLLLNKQLNEQGGFLRKTATLIQYIKEKHKRQKDQWSLSINRLELFETLKTEDKQALFNLFEIRKYQSNEAIFHQGDPLNSFYIIKQGIVKLRQPDLGLKAVQTLYDHDTFGHFGFLTSCRSAFMAQANGEVVVWVINREKLNNLLGQSDSFYNSLQTYFDEAPELIDYLQQEHQCSATQAAEKLFTCRQTLSQQRQLPDAKEEAADYEQAVERLQNTRRFELFSDNNEAINAILAGKLKYRHARAGETLFTHHTEADRLYLLESGEIELIDPKKHLNSKLHLHPGDFFGGMAFVVGGKHISTAVAKTDISYWVLERKELNNMLLNLPMLHSKLDSYLKDNRIHDYLIEQQEMSESKVEEWVKQSTKSITPTELPKLPDLNIQQYRHQAAYLAIWLGILLDGIPESLMIGTHVSDGQMITLSLLAAIFISNYPEALSSSASMREQGIPFSKILLAWTSIMLMTGIGAAIGSMTLHDTSPETFAFISGIAAGAMLTVIAETMLPEAYARGGSVTGFITLIGFLTAILFKLFD